MTSLRPRSWLIPTITLAIVLAAIAIPATAAPGHDRVDVLFAQKMRHHHLLGIEMAQMAATKAARQQTRALAQQAIADQRSQAARLTRFLRRSHKPLTATESDARRNADADDMTTLQQTPAGLEFERAFLQIFQRHHFDAIDMAEMEASGGRNAAVQSIARQIVIGQTRQAADMERLQGELRDPTP